MALLGFDDGSYFELLAPQTGIGGSIFGSEVIGRERRAVHVGGGDIRYQNGVEAFA